MILKNTLPNAINVFKHLLRERLTGERRPSVAGSRSEGLAKTAEKGTESDDDDQRVRDGCSAGWIREGKVAICKRVADSP